MVLSGLVGIGFNAYFPIAFQSYVESNYPCFELVLTTCLMVISNVNNFINLLKIFCYISTELLVIPFL